MNRYGLAVLAFVVFAVSPVKSIALEVLTAKELASRCAAFPYDADSADGQFCIRYIQGFLDGAVATDVRVMLNMEAKAENKENFSERAIRVRAVDRTSQRRAAVYAEYCLGDPVPLVEVVNKVVKDLRQPGKSDGASASARDAVYASLRKHYACNR